MEAAQAARRSRIVDPAQRAWRPARWVATIRARAEAARSTSGAAPAEPAHPCPLERVCHALIGRWPADIKWRATNALPPAADGALGDLLRQCHLYLTASLWEPCGAHHVEGVQCGLPLIYHEDGGGIVEAGQKYGLGFRDNLAAVLGQARAQYGELRERVIGQMPNGDEMCLQFARVITKLIVER